MQRIKKKNKQIDGIIIDDVQIIRFILFLMYKKKKIRY